ncbi:PulJ/GspJ family protein [Fontisphaera persica]|uniref:PulJ/GspJ family protein n=1 Tax=Fontisphaera persica TaxID=2974023 RepID=UPI003CCE26C4
MTASRSICSSCARRKRAFTLAEVLIAMSISVLIMGSIVYGYLGTATRAEWNAYSLAAQSLALQRIEQARSCKWDPEASPPIDQLVASNFPPEVNILDIPVSGTNIVYATNFTTITVVSADPPTKCVMVQCVWNFKGRRNYTNTVVTYRAPDS